MYDHDIDQIWVTLNKLADDQDDLNRGLKAAIEAARRDDRSWSEIAKTLRLSSEDDAKTLYRRLSDQTVGID